MLLSVKDHLEAWDGRSSGDSATEKWFGFKFFLFFFANIMPDYLIPKVRL